MFVLRISNLSQSEKTMKPYDMWLDDVIMRSRWAHGGVTRTWWGYRIGSGPVRGWITAGDVYIPFRLHLPPGIRYHAGLIPPRSGCGEEPRTLKCAGHGVF